MSDAYAFWRAAVAGEPRPEHLPTIGAPIPGENPQPGEWKVRRQRGAPWTLLSIWLADERGEPAVEWRDGLTLHALLGNIESLTPDQLARMWLFAEPVSEEDALHWRETERWLTDPPADITPAAPKPDETAPPSPRTHAIVKGDRFHGTADDIDPPGPGHNSGDPTSFEAMRAQLEGDIAEAQAFYARNPIRSKTDADRCENWRKRIYDAAKALDEMRKAEKKPHQDKADAVDALFFPVIRPAQEFSGRNGPLDKLGQAYIAAEQARLRKEAEERAAAEHARRMAEAEAERQRIIAERERLKADEPAAYLTTPEPELPDPAAIAPPVVEAPKVMIGTSGTRRGAQSAQHTATITDAAKLAAHLVAQRHPDLLDCLQKVANAAARSKARTTLPGCRMSWETERAA